MSRNKDYSFARFFNSKKNPMVSKYSKKMEDKVVWDSYRKGTYIREIHGEL